MTRSRALALCLAALAVAPFPSCATVRRARAIQDPASELPGERTATAEELGLPTTGAVELGAILSTALQCHPRIVQARHDSEAARDRVREVEASLLPQVSTSASIGYRDAQASSGSSVQHDFRSFGFDVSWLLFDFEHTKDLARNLAELWVASQAELKTAEVDTAFGVRSAYFDLARQQGLLAVAQDSVQQYQIHLEQVQGFVEVGTRIPYDETKAEVDLGNARLLEVKARDAVLAAQATLANAVGLAEVVDWTPTADPPVPQVPEEFDEAWKLARERQPILAAAWARELAASALVDARIAALYPSLNLGFDYAASGSSFPLSWNWLIGPVLQWTPFNGFQNLATIDESVASLRAARAARAEAEQQTWLDLRTAWLAIRDAQQRVHLTALTARSAVENLQLAQGLFEVGKGTSVELADAQQSLVQSKAEEVQARADWQVAVSQLARAIGISAAEE